MGAIQGPDKYGSIEITYGGRECPYTGLDTSFQPPYIGPGALALGSVNVLPVDNSLVVAGLQSQQIFTLSPTQILIGTGDLNNTQFLVYFDTSNNTLYVSSNSTQETTAYPTFGSSYSVALPNMSLCPTPLAGTLTYKNVNGICYFSFSYCPYILLHDGQQVLILTDYLGCAYLNELNGRLVAANVFQIPQATPDTTDVTTPATETITVVNVRFNTVSTTGTAMFFPSVSVGATAAVSIVVTWNWNVINNFPGGSNPHSYYGNCQMQISFDTGSTWTDFYNNTSAPDANYTSGPLSITLSYTGATISNLNTVAIRMIVSAAGADLPNIVFTSGMVTSATANVTNTPIAPVFFTYPFQFAWCAALQQYAIWNPIAATGFVSGAGFNNLPDVEDAITGLFMEGPTGYIIREQGLTEVTPLNSGIQPFDFNHLWASHLGIGSIYTNTASQYGALGFFIANDDIYTIGYSGVNVIAGKAKSTIFNNIINGVGDAVYSGVFAACGVLGIDGCVSPVYAIAVNINGVINVYVYWQVTGEWYVLQIPAGADTLFFPAGFNFISGPGFTDVNRLVFIGSDGVNVTQYTIATTSNSIEMLPEQNVVINFKPEEVMILRDVTIDSIIVYLELNCSIDMLNGMDWLFTITGTSDGGVVVQALVEVQSDQITPNIPFQYLKLVPFNGNNLFTGWTPQLTVTLQNNQGDNEFMQLKIAKIVLLGHVDVTQRPQ